MSTRQILPGPLAEGPSHGYALKRRCGERFPRGRPLAFGQAHMPLQRLVRDGSAQVDGAASDRHPQRTVYRLTDEGTRESAEWTAEVAPSVPSTSNEVFPEVAVAILVGSDPAAYLHHLDAEPRWPNTTAARLTVLTTEIDAS
ncbi:PadR family transcriptional regulator [Streptomyces sp. NPDC006385]|uniref:PadR family transcriptional regulator n=1 Tax=Streptomyces sp. NPDC006385 TaxID=3156761 RepID=UPI0033A5A6D6